MAGAGDPSLSESADARGGACRRADDPDATTKKGRVCEANFYSGELALQRGAKDEATQLFQLAVTGCPKFFIEYNAAKAELKALGAKP
jgi:lipoprotein NlpI